MTATGDPPEDFVSLVRDITSLDRDEVIKRLKVRVTMPARTHLCGFEADG